MKAKRLLLKSQFPPILVTIPSQIPKFSSGVTIRSNPISPTNPTAIYVMTLIKRRLENGQLREGRKLFDEILQRDVVTWTAMITLYTSHGHYDHAWVAFCNMKRAGTDPNAFTISNVLRACKGMGSCLHGTVVQGMAIKLGVDGCMYVENALVDMYAICGDSMDVACMIFERIPVKTAASWTTMIAGYMRRGEGGAAIRVFRQMRQEDAELNPFSCSVAIRASASIGSLVFGKQMHTAAIKHGFQSNLPVSNSLVDMYCRCSSLAEAKKYFDEMPCRDLITWNALIAGFERYHSQESLHLFSQMFSQDINPNCFTFTSIAATCANLAVLNCGQQVHGMIIQRGYGGNLPLSNALIDMYAKCGSIHDSRRVFDGMPQRDLFSWTSMMIGFGTHGYGREAVELFDRMIISGVRPDRIVFMGVLSACSHAGLVDEGLKYFDSMPNNYNILPNREIYGCVVDLLGRAGRVKEAYELIERMPFIADESVWGALLGACKVHRFTNLGRLAAQKILDMTSDGAKTYVMLSNIYAADGTWGEFAKMRKLMKGTGSKKEVGMSWIEVRSQVYSFVVGESMSSPYVELVHAMLEMLAQHMKDAGFVPAIDCLTNGSEDGC